MNVIARPRRIFPAVFRSGVRLDSKGGKAKLQPQNAETQMRNLKIIEHISLDGVIQHATDDDFPYSDWTTPYRAPAGRDAILAVQGERFDLLLGRRTYDLWSEYWPKAPSGPMADRLNAATKYVATHRPESLEWGPFEAPNLWSCRNGGSSSAQSPGSTDAGDWPRTGSASTTRGVHSCVGLPSASCSESFAKTQNDPGETLRCALLARVRPSDRRGGDHGECLSTDPFDPFEILVLVAT